ncbi:hypothetical protein V2J09_013451 [Rumex salicifolius]
MSLCGGRIVGSMALPGSNPAQFPAGLRVLVVDDDPTCLKILEKMLQACQYEVTKCDRAEYALNELRRNKNGFDIVLSDVHMPDMDGFKLLEYIGLEMDLPVIMMSADDGKNVVMKGVTHGACDYLIKPVRIEALKNIWQHVVRKKKNEWKDIEQSGSVEEVEKAQRHEETEYSSPANEGSWKCSKRKLEDEDTDDKDESSSMKKPRVVWSVELHQQFVAAVNQLGIDKSHVGFIFLTFVTIFKEAVPKKILDLMNVPGLTRENVASHLQKYRLYLRRLSGVSHHQGGLNTPFMSPHDAAFGAMAQLGGIDLQTLAASGQLPSQPLSGYQPGIARPVIRPGMSLPFADQRNLFSFEAPKQHMQQLSNNNGNKQINLLHGIPTTMELKQIPGFHQPVISDGSSMSYSPVLMAQPQARPGILMNDNTQNRAQAKSFGSNYNVFNELPIQKSQDWRSSSLSYVVPQRAKHTDVSPSVMINQGFPVGPKPGQFVKTEQDHEISPGNNLYQYQFAQDDLMSAILKQQGGIESVVQGEFDLDGFSIDNIPVYDFERAVKLKFRFRKENC